MATLRSVLVGGASAQERDATDRPVAGDRIGPWRIDAVLGEGAHGLVYAVAGPDGRSATLKLARDKAGAEVGEAEALLRREAEVLGRIRHPNVVSCLGLEQHDGRSILLLDPIEGESLADRLGRDRRGEPEAAFDDAALTDLLRGLAAGLEAVHEAGYLHGDVKPANIFIGPDGCPLLVDFGTAEPRAETTRGEIGHATPGYAAIEQYQSDGLEGPWTDLYALAAVAYRIVSGRPPAPSPSRAAGEAMLSAARTGKDRFRAPLLAAIDAALVLDPEKRPRSVAGWLAAFDAEDSPAIERLEAPKTAEVEAAPSSPEISRAVPPVASAAGAAAESSPPAVVADEVGEPRDALDDLPPTEKVTRLPISLQGADRPAFGSLRAAGLRAERRERESRAPTRSGRSRLGFLAAAVVLAVLGFGGWEGYLRYVKSEWRVDPAGNGDAESLAEALTRARDGSNVYLAPGRYPETVLLTRAVNLIGPEDPETPAVVEPSSGPCLLSNASGASVTRLVLVRPASAEETLPVEDGGPCVVIAASLRVEDSRVSSAAGPAVVIRDGADPALTRVAVGETAGHGIVVEGGAKGTISESLVQAAAKTGILVRDQAAPTVTGTRIEKAGQSGLLVTTGAGGLYEGNEIIGSAASAVEVREGADPEIRDNLLSGARQAGIYVYDGGKGRLTGNRIADNAFSGVVVAGGGAPEVSGNEITGNGEHGVALLDDGGGRIADNRIADNRGHGIVRADGSPAELGQNRLSGNLRPQLQVGRRSGG